MCTRSTGAGCSSAIALLALIPLGVELPALATLSILTAIACALIAYEAIRFADARDRVRHDPVADGGS